MATVTITFRINTDSAAMEDGGDEAIAAFVQATANRIANGGLVSASRNLLDDNGNTVGKVTIRKGR